MDDKLDKLRNLIDNISKDNAFDESLEVLQQLRVAFKEDKSLFSNADIIFLKGVKDFLETYSKKTNRLQLIKSISNKKQLQEDIKKGNKRNRKYINTNKIDKIVFGGINKRKSGKSTSKPLLLKKDYKQYINEGIAGSREEVKKSNGQIFSDMLKRNKE